MVVSRRGHPLFGLSNFVLSCRALEVQTPGDHNARRNHQHDVEGGAVGLVEGPEREHDDAEAADGAARRMVGVMRSRS